MKEREREREREREVNPKFPLVYGYPYIILLATSFTRKMSESSDSKLSSISMLGNICYHFT